MNKIFIIAVAAAALAACNNQDQTTAADPGDVNAAEANAAEASTANVVLPPAILASKTYRCQDNSPAYIDWLSDNVSANFRASRSDLPTQLTAPAAGEPLVAEGYSLTGTATSPSITLERPGVPSQTCNA